jgi:uncharacterized protein RhaS with RHS repeats
MKTHQTFRTEMPAIALLAWLLLPQTGYSFYNPGTGRWLSRDPIGERGGDNRYTFVRNCSTVLRDPLGLEVSASACAKLVSQMDASNSTIQWFRKRMAAHKPPCKLKVKCECCTGGGSFKAGGKEGDAGTLLLCYGGANDIKQMTINYIHEMSHAYDSCYGLNADTCENRACTEIRAIISSGQCDDGSPWRRTSETKEDCVRRQAAENTSANPDWKCGDGKESVKKAWDRCYYTPKPEKPSVPRP